MKLVFSAVSSQAVPINRKSCEFPANMSLKLINEKSDDTKRKVYEMFGRNEEMVEDDVNIIRTWLQSQPHLPEIMEDVQIRNFLNLCKFSIEKTKKKIDMYYTIRGLLPEYFERCNPKLGFARQLLENTYMTVLPNPLDGVHTVYFIKQKQPDTINVMSYLNVWLALFEIRLYEDFMVDDIIIYDFKTTSFGDLKKITPSLLAKFVTIYEKVYSLRLRKVVYLNCPPFLPFLAQLLKTVLKPKIFDRIQFNPDEKALHEFLPKDSIPEDYGGNGPSLDELNEIALKKIEEYQDRFDKLDELRVNEDLRPEKLNNDEILGYYGSFKKINID